MKEQAVFQIFLKFLRTNFLVFWKIQDIYGGPQSIWKIPVQCFLKYIFFPLGNIWVHIHKNMRVQKDLWGIWSLQARHKGAWGMRHSPAVAPEEWEGRGGSSLGPFLTHHCLWVKQRNRKLLKTMVVLVFSFQYVTYLLPIEREDCFEVQMSLAIVLKQFILKCSYRSHY